MKNFLMILKFDGTNYHGWQIQKNAITVQEVFQRAIKKVFKVKPEIKGCSRTDSGVHANMYCVSVRLPELIPVERISLVVNKFLPNDMSVIDCYEVCEKFHARYSCFAKEYIYLIYNSKVRDPFLNKKVLNYWHPIDIKLMNLAAKKFIGSHDFYAFYSFGTQRKTNTIRTIYDFGVKKNKDIIKLVIKADGFLHNMVRILVGTLLNVNYGRIEHNDIVGIIESRDRSRAGDTVSPCGLYLNRVFYPEGLVKF
jgi:tRNA pseudouridine38-40 synthase